MPKKIILFIILSLLTNVIYASGKDIFKYIDNNDFENIFLEISVMDNVDITNVESFENTPLMEVSFKLENESQQYQNIALMLLMKGANPNYKNVFGSSALLYAVKLHSTTIFLENCKKFGANFEERHHSNSGTLLLASMENGHYLASNITRFILDNSDLVNVATTAGFTPLIFAMMNNCRHYEGCGFKRQEIRDLVNYGAKINVEDKYYGLTALEHGVDSMSQTYVTDFQDIQFLIDHGAIVDKDAVDLAETPLLKEFLKARLTVK